MYVCEEMRGFMPLLYPGSSFEFQDTYIGVVSNSPSSSKQNTDFFNKYTRQWDQLGLCSLFVCEYSAGFQDYISQSCSWFRFKSESPHFLFFCLGKQHLHNADNTLIFLKLTKGLNFRIFLCAATFPLNIIYLLWGNRESSPSPQIVNSC